MTGGFSEAEKREIALRAAAILAASVETVEQAALEVERQTGERILHRRPALADATRQDLELLAAQAEAGAQALREALPWVPSGSTLGRVIKTLPAHLAFELTRKLRAAGLDV
jgi:hypothetical protein